ncbi:hypothetical protein [Methanobrevibacter sp.]|uniref:hypothetical protein n=1 Tax=Methanobrevibacter sp. TaxID=66852 RepID=UPI00386BF559
MREKITYDDLKEHEHLFLLAPSFILGGMAKRNSNLITKFRPAVESHLNKLSDDERSKLHVILDSDIDDLQKLLRQAYIKTKIRQYAILSDPKNRDFIELNLNELRKLI